MRPKPGSPLTNPHLPRRRTGLSGAALVAAAVLSLTACGFDSTSQSASAARPNSPSAASSATPSSSTPSAPASTPSPTAVVNANEVLRTAPDVAQAFAQQALGDAAVVNSPTIREAVTKISAFLTDSMAADLLAKGDTEDAFHLLPFKIAGLADGQPVTQAEVNVTSAGIMQTTADFTQVRVVADYKWYFGPQGWLKGTRTYELVMRPGTDPDGLAWQVNGMTGSDVEWTLGD